MTTLAHPAPRSLLAELRTRQPQLFALGMVSLVVLLLCLAAMTLDARQINGVSVWTKPAKFAASFVAWNWTLAWAWGVLAPTARHHPLARVVLWGTLASAGFELVWITLRGALGTPSHFAGDPLGGFMYGLMGVGAVMLVALAAVLGFMVLRLGDPAQPPAWRRAVGLGLLLGGVAGGVTGVTISVLDGPIIGAPMGDAGTWPPFHWSRTAGDLRTSHFLGTHAMQAVPAVVLLLGARATPAVVGVAALAWLGLTGAAYSAALAGRPLMP
ncbi:MAG: hypothetical protein K2X74_11845 [Acetobacteraceae bacterium]|nr:hypothetical protein [Acetobacteraceae bacterium]